MRGGCAHPNRSLGEKPKGHRSLGVTLGLGSRSAPYGTSQELDRFERVGGHLPWFPSALCNPIWPHSAAVLFLTYALNSNHTRACVFPWAWGPLCPTSMPRLHLGKPPSLPVCFLLSASSASNSTQPTPPFRHTPSLFVSLPLGWDEGLLTQHLSIVSTPRTNSKLGPRLLPPGVYAGITPP